MVLSAGVVALQVLPDTSKFGARLKGDTEKSVGGLKGHLSGLGQSMGANLSAGLGIGVAAAFGAVLKTGWGEVKDASAGTAQLAAGIKSTGNAAGVTVGDLNKLAGSIQGYSGQTDDSIVKSEQLLLTFTNIKNNGPDKIFDQATRASADMAAKMGGDASSNAILLGKALNDPVKGITALTRVGVAFTAGQKASIKAMVAHGNTAGAQKVILKELQTEFGGAAKAAGNSLPGQMAKAKRSFEDLSQSVVSALVPVVTPLLQALPPIIEKVGAALKTAVGFISDHQTVFKVLGAVLGVVTAAVVAYNVAVTLQALKTKVMIVAGNVWSVATKVWAAGQWLLNAAMSANPIGLVIIAVVALVAVFIIAWKHSETFRKIVTGAFHAVLSAVTGAFHWIRSNWPLLLAILTGPIGLAVLLITKHWDAIKAGVTKVKDWIVDKFNAVVGFFTGLPGRMVQAVAGLWDPIRDAFKDVINFVIRGWNGLHFGIPKIHIKGTSVDVGGGTFGVPHIPELAQGGIVTRPTLAVLGEKGPEAVIPLPRNGMAGGGINVTVHNPRPEKASESVPAALRRVAYAHGLVSA